MVVLEIKGLEWLPERYIARNGTYPSRRESLEATDLKTTLAKSGARKCRTCALTVVCYRCTAWAAKRCISKSGLLLARGANAQNGIPCSEGCQALGCWCGRCRGQSLLYETLDEVRSGIADSDKGRQSLGVESSGVGSDG